MALAITSPAFAAGQPIPVRYTCDGDDVSPPLAWSGVPAAARSLALIVHDPDAPDPRAPTRDFVHWIVYDIPVSAVALAEGLERLPPGARAGTSDWYGTAWRGPCPPAGRHRYVFRLVALDSELGDLREPTRHALEAAMKGHVLATAELVGTFGRVAA